MTGYPLAFVPGGSVARARHAEGPLSGLTFAVKDLFDLRGHRSSAGHPDWARTHPSAEADAPAVKALLEAGGDLVGVTIMDELAYSLTGQNPFYGTPQNPRAPERLCGGSSCGSAAAVAGCMCDFALGTDTGGSIRVPASFCGLFEAVAGVLLGPLAPAPRVERVLVADDALALCDAGVPELLEHLAGKVVAELQAKVEQVQVAPKGFAALRLAFTRMQAREVIETHGAWLDEVQPKLSPGVAQRIARARELYESEEGLEEDAATLRALRRHIEGLLTPGTVLFMPPAAGMAPRVDASAAELDTYRARTLELTAMASLLGLPQVVVPTPDVPGGAPVGLSFVAAHGQDELVCSLARVSEGALG